MFQPSLNSISWGQGLLHISLWRGTVYLNIEESELFLGEATGFLQRALGFSFADHFFWVGSFISSLVLMEAAIGGSLSQPKQWVFTEVKGPSEAVQLQLELNLSIWNWSKPQPCPPSSTPPQALTLGLGISSELSKHLEATPTSTQLTLGCRVCGTNLEV